MAGASPLVGWAQRCPAAGRRAVAAAQLKPWSLWSRAFAGASSAQQAPRHGRPTPQHLAAPRRRVAVRRDHEPGEFQSCLEALQGSWGDDSGVTIEVSGSKAHFGDGSGPWTFEEAEGALVLRGARLVGTAAAPIWQLPTGAVRRWARAEPPGVGDRTWADLFLRYKEDRLQLRWELQAALAARDFDKFSTLRAAWEEGGVSSRAAPPGPSTAAGRAALATGRFLVPGVCFRHRKFQYRGVILGCEPWCVAPAAWRAQMGVPQLPRGEAQPFYHCLVDERDRSGGQVTFFAEDNVEPCNFSFPITSEVADALLLRCDELGGYLPGKALQDALQRQLAGGGFLL